MVGTSSACGVVQWDRWERQKLVRSLRGTKCQLKLPNLEAEVGWGGWHGP